MKKNKELNYSVEAMEKLPEKWSYLHEVLKVNIEKPGDFERPGDEDAEIKIYFVPTFKYFVIKESSLIGDLIKTRIFNYPFSEYIFEEKDKISLLSRVVSSKFLLKFPNELVEEFKEKFYKIYDLFNNNEKAVNDIPIEEVSEKEEYDFLYEIIIKHRNILNNVSHKGLYGNHIEDVLLDVLFDEDNDMSKDNRVHLHRDNNNNFHVVVDYRENHFSFPLRYKPEKVREVLYYFVGRYYSSPMASLLIYYIYLRFKKDLKYYNIIKDLSIYNYPDIKFFNLGSFDLFLGESAIINIVPIKHNSEYYFRIYSRAHFILSNFDKPLEYFFMNQESTENLLSYYINPYGEITDELRMSVKRLLGFIIDTSRINIFGGESQNGLDYEKLLKNYIEIKYNEESNGYSYRRYRKYDTIDIELKLANRNTILYNVTDLEESENSFNNEDLCTITKNEDLKDYPENLKNMKRYIQAIKELNLGPETICKPEVEMEPMEAPAEVNIETDECFREGEINDTEK